jgi:hypothetical protein
MKIIDLTVESNVQTEHYLIFIEHGSISIVINEAENKAFRFKTPALADQFVRRFVTEAVSAAEDSGWRVRIGRFMEYLAMEIGTPQNPVIPSTSPNMTYSFIGAMVPPLNEA